MQLDETRIAIRERNYLELLDLALAVVRRQPLATLFASLLVPLFFCLNDALVRVVLDDMSLSAEDEFSVVFFGVWSSSLLVWLELPLATAPITIVLGQGLFVAKPSAWRVVKDYLISLPQLILFQGILRGLTIPFFVTMLVSHWGWPFLTEVIVLERNPWRRKSKQGAGSLGRAMAVHRHYNADVAGRWFTSLFIGGALLTTTMGSIFMMGAYSGWYDNESVPHLIFIYQMSIWIVSIFFTIVRFLAYLDTRIRSEGWEIELAMRAEAARLARQLA